MRNIRLIVLILLIVFGVFIAWWLINKQLWSTDQLMSGNTQAAREYIAKLDTQLADKIKKTAENGISWPKLPGSNVIEQASQASLSATYSTTPEKIWQDINQSGGAGVVQGIANDIELNVNDLSTQVIDEARYQYCLGVVEQYESQQSEAP